MQLGYQLFSNLPIERKKEQRKLQEKKGVNPRFHFRAGFISGNHLLGGKEHKLENEEESCDDVDSGGKGKV